MCYSTCLCIVNSYIKHYNSAFYNDNHRIVEENGNYLILELIQLSCPIKMKRATTSNISEKVNYTYTENSARIINFELRIIYT